MSTEKAKCECQNCKAEILVDYIRLGTHQTCWQCLRSTIPLIPNGGPIPISGRELTYKEFESLLCDPPAVNDISKFLRIHFNYSLLKEFDGWQIMNSAQEAIDRLWLHLKIQGSPELSGELYNIAMSLWHS